MQKRYLLLRNNQQTGPFTIDELLQQHLTASDLVWVEDQSTAWLFPYEIEELRFAAAGAAAAKRGQRHIYVSYPVRPIPWMEKKTANPQKYEPPKASTGANFSNSDLERKAEELRQRALSWKPADYYHPAIDEMDDHEHYSIPERPIHFEFHRRKKYVTLEHLMVVGLISVMAIAGWYRGWAPLRNRMSTTEETVTPLVSVDNHTAKKNNRPAANSQVPVQNNQQPLATLPLTDSAKNDSIVMTDMPKKEIAKKKKPAKISIPIIIKPDVAQTQKEEPILPPDPSANSDKSIAASDVKPNTDDASEKKKERKGFLGGLFKKKKKDTNTEQESSE